jgi:hypothetical protein
MTSSQEVCGTGKESTLYLGEAKASIGTSLKLLVST